MRDAPPAEKRGREPIRCLRRISLKADTGVGHYALGFDEFIVPGSNELSAMLESRA